METHFMSYWKDKFWIEVLEAEIKIVVKSEGMTADMV